MKEKLLQFFTGKMSKTVYISIASAVVCGAVVITSTVIVHNNNQKIDSVLESLDASESVAESVTESAAESVSDTGNTDSGVQAKAANSEPASDKAQQYSSEYEKLTTEYQNNKTKLQAEYDANRPQYAIMPEPRDRKLGGAGNPLETEEEYAQYLKEYEIEKQRREEENSQREETLKHIAEQIRALDTQYEKDVAALKSKYGIT